MKTWVHTVLSLILAALLYKFFNWRVLFILIGGVLVDADHYFWYVFKFNKFSLPDCYDYFTRVTVKTQWKDIIGSFLIFHTVEFLILSIILSFYSSYALLFTIGLIGHYLLDSIWHLNVPKRAVLNFSIIHWIIKNKIQKA